MTCLPARRTTTSAILGCMLAAAMPAQADEFALSVSPPRFELAAKPGQTVRAVVELANASQAATVLTFATAEWELADDGSLTTDTALKPDTCRPWVAIERRRVALPPQSQMRYRFEVTPPADAQPVECRFAIVISGQDTKVVAGETVSFPLAAQIALIVYVAVGDVKPALRIVEADVVEIGGEKLPVLRVENTGSAHGRLAAFLTGTDANGRKREFSPSTLPILPGETRTIALNVDQGEDAVETSVTGQTRPSAPAPIAWPLRMTGTINDKNSSYRFEGTFEPR